jgi:hypothetical protein
MKKLIYSSIIIAAILAAIVSYKYLFTPRCQNIEGQIQLWNDFMPEALLKELHTNPSLAGTFCIKLTGDQTTVPYDDRVIEYVKVIRYKIEDDR